MTKIYKDTEGEQADVGMMTFRVAGLNWIATT